MVITPQVNLSPRSNVGISTGNSFSVKEVEDAEKEVHNAEFLASLSTESSTESVESTEPAKKSKKKSKKK